MSKLERISIPLGNDELLSVTIDSPEKSPKGIVIEFHGFPGGPANPDANYTLNIGGTKVPAGNLHTKNHYFTDTGYKVVGFNYPGIWGTEGKFSAENNIHIGKIVIDFIIKNYPDLPVFVYAWSFGGSVVTNILANNNFDCIKALFLRAPVHTFVQETCILRVKGKITPSLEKKEGEIFKKKKKN